MSRQAIRDLFTDMGIELQLKNLLRADKSKITDMYCPDARRSPITDGAVQHNDVVSCWKGMSFLQASELASWEKNFKLSLEKMMADILIHVFTEYLRAEKVSVNEWTMESTLAKFLSVKNPRLMDIAVPDLVTEMIERFYATGSNLVHTWFISSRDLPRMVFNFIRTHDCWIDSYPFPSIAINFSVDRTDYGLCILGNVEWFPPVIDFYNLPSALPVGAEYRITCSHIEQVLTESFQLFPADPEFIVSSNRLPLAWDSNKRCFRAIVPEDKSRTESEQQQRDIIAQVTGEKKGNKLETCFSAKLITPFPGLVRYEETTRYTLVLEILPKVARSLVMSPIGRPTSQSTVHQWKMLYVPGPMDERSPSEETSSIHLSHSPEAFPVDPQLAKGEPMPVAQRQQGSWSPGAQRHQSSWSYDSLHDTVAMNSAGTSVVAKGLASEGLSSPEEEEGKCGHDAPECWRRRGRIVRDACYDIPDNDCRLTHSHTRAPDTVTPALERPTRHSEAYLKFTTDFAGSPVPTREDGKYSSPHVPQKRKANKQVSHSPDRNVHCGTLSVESEAGHHAQTPLEVTTKRQRLNARADSCNVCLSDDEVCHGTKPLESGESSSDVNITIKEVRGFRRSHAPSPRPPKTFDHALSALVSEGGDVVGGATNSSPKRAYRPHALWWKEMPTLEKERLVTEAGVPDTDSSKTAGPSGAPTYPTPSVSPVETALAEAFPSSSLCNHRTFTSLAEHSTDSPDPEWANLNARADQLACKWIEDIYNRRISPTELEMQRIRRNYEQALQRKREWEHQQAASTKAKLDGARDDDEEAMAKVFLAKSESEGGSPNGGSCDPWESDSELSDLMDRTVIAGTTET